MKELVNSNTVTMSSLEIAELTGKRHDNVMADVRKMLKELNTDATNFLGTQTYGNNNTREIFNLPKRECLILVSGYSVVLRAKIIDRWQELETAQSKPLTPAEFLLAQAQRMVEVERKQKEHDDRIHRIEAKQTAFEEGHSYFTVLGYCAYKGITVDLTAAKSLGKRATALSHEQDIPVDRVKDSRFGQVNAYHETILDTLVAEEL